MIEVDPKIEQAFAEVLARSRHRAADITDQLAAAQRQIAERSERLRQEGQRLSEELDRQVAERQESSRNPWQNRAAKSTLLDFGGEDEDGRRAAAQPPTQQPQTQPIAGQAPATPPLGLDLRPAPPEPPAAPEAAPVRMLSFDFEDEAESAAPRRPAARPRPADTDEDDDWSGRSWMR